MVTIKFDTGNSAFRDLESPKEVDLNSIAATVREVAHKIEKGEMDGRVKDYNGNIVGTYKVR
jgi:hypothetical protein